METPAETAASPAKPVDDAAHDAQHGDLGSEQQALADELSKAKAALAAKDASIKSMQQKAKDYVAAVDKKWKTKVDELERQVAELNGQVQSLTAELGDARAQLQQRPQAGGDDENDVEVLRAERDVASQIAEAEKRRSSELAAQVTALQTAQQAAAASASSKAHHSAAALTKAHARIDALQAEVSSLKRSDTSLKSTLSEAQSIADERGLELASALSRVEALEARAHTAEQQVGMLQYSNASLQQQLEAYGRDLDSARRTAAETSARETTSSAAAADASGRLQRLEGQYRAEKSEWASTRLRLEESLSARNAERERLMSEVGRLTRQYEDAAADVRRLRAGLSDAETTATAARNALASAESRAADAEARLSVLQSSMKSSDGASGRLRAEAAAASADMQRFKLEIDRLTSELSASRAREAEAHAEMLEARRAAVDLEGVAAAGRARVEASDARVAAAQREAGEHQRKRLEAKTELVAVAQQLEAERGASHALAAALGSSVLPKLSSLVDGVHNLAATLDPGYGAAHPRAGGGAGAAGRPHRAPSDAEPPSPMDEDETASLVAGGGSSSVRVLRAGSGGGGPALTIRNGLLVTGTGHGQGSNSPEAVGEYLAALLDDAQAAVYAATRAAAAVARSKRRGLGRFGLGTSPPPSAGGAARTPSRTGGPHGQDSDGDGDGDETPLPLGALGLLTSCFRTVTHHVGGTGHTPGPVQRQGQRQASYARAAMHSPGAAGSLASANPRRLSDTSGLPRQLELSGPSGFGRSGVDDRDAVHGAASAGSGRPAGLSAKAQAGHLSSVQADTSSIRQLHGEDLDWARQQAAKQAARSGAPRGPPVLMSGTASGFAK